MRSGAGGEHPDIGGTPAAPGGGGADGGDGGERSDSDWSLIEVRTSRAP